MKWTTWVKLALLVILGLGLVWHFLGVNATDEHGMTALMRAARAGDVNEAHRLLNGYAAVNKQVPTNHLQAIWSVMGGFQKIPERDSGWTALTYASAAGQAEIVKALLDAGGADVNVRAAGNATPLLVAQDPAVVRLLLNAKADNAVDESASDYTALKAAKSGKHMEVAPLLETAGAKK